MAVLALTSKLLVEGYRKYPIDRHGKIRFAFFDMQAITVAGDDGSTIDLFYLPPGRIRMLPSMSRINASAFGASRTLKIGHTAYITKDDGTTEAANDTAFTASALDISSATADLKWGTTLKYDLYSKSGILVQAKCVGGTVPVNATLIGYAAYIYE